MSKSTLILVAVAAILAARTDATEVDQCSDSRAVKSTTILTNCDQPPCKLKKGETTGVTQRFTPDHDVQDLVTKVKAKIGWFWVPFVGVHDTSACPKIYLASDDSLAGCPLKKGVEYVYKNEIPVESVYPSISPRVWWALQENDDDVTCFEVEAEIVS